MATLTFPAMSPRDDAIQLYRAFKGLGCDTAAVVNILAHRDAAWRALIGQEYKAMYSEDIHKRLASELTGKLETAVLLWMHDLPGRDAVVVKQGLSPDKKNLEGVTEVICSRTPSQIQIIKQHYHAKFGVPLEHDIELQTSGDHKKLLLAYVSAPRSEGIEVSEEMAEKDAKVLYKADEKTLINIFCQRSRAQLSAISSAYPNMYENSLKKAVKKETCGNFEHALLTILQCAENPGKYFAKVLHNAMKGLGTDHTILMRVIVTRTEIDMQYIKVEYLKKYKETLNVAVPETSGHYRTFLLSLLGPNN